ncbi:RING-H2 finger protein [Actinidia chinensis var. chinensis]|uniref:RING-H2 finger protein n=1 Tax=Actinidia chinensis var. chinensis TaxID=1590841 RepID=A0A2R6RTJ9_ACTCC|nr:RING-H2 finger protein [Actinidia chinensis var. chinensis]
MRTEPLVDALAVKTMAAIRQHLHFLSIFKHAEANTALGFAETRRRGGGLVKHDLEAVNCGRVESEVLSRRRRRVGRMAGRGVAEATDPAGVEEEEEDGEEDGGEEEGVAADLEDAIVVEFGVMPVEALLRVL